MDKWEFPTPEVENGEVSELRMSVGNLGLQAKDNFPPVFFNVATADFAKESLPRCSARKVAYTRNGTLRHYPIESDSVDNR